jgi:hypothetical protein
MITHDEQNADRPQSVEMILILQGRFHPMQTNYPHLASRWNSYSVQAFKLALLGFRLLSLKAWRAKNGSIAKS